MHAPRFCRPAPAWSCRRAQGLGRYADAEPFVREALEIWGRTLDAKDATRARGRHNLAFILLGLGRAAEALIEVRQALAVHEKVLGPSHFYTRGSARTCARALDAVGSAAEAAALRSRFDPPIDIGAKT